MERDTERIARVQAGLKEQKLDALICGLHENVLMLSGYWPMVGTSVAVMTREGRVSLIVPTDERELAQLGWADEIQTYEPASMTRLTSAEQEILDPLAKLCHKLGLDNKRLGYEGGASFEASAYAAAHLFGATMIEVLRQASSASPLVNATPMLMRLRSVLSPSELARLHSACSIVQQAFIEAAHAMHAGMRETEIAALFRTPLSTKGTGFHHAVRADGFCYCMSGPDAANASAAFARSTSREVRAGDMALVHCNSYADGMWTDVTRTYSLGEPGNLPHKIYAAIFEARQAGLDAVRPGATGADVDRAAREVMRAHGFESEFRHGTGHGVGFAAINHNAAPRIHPKSEDVLETGMVFNVEPAVYIDGWGGARHCDVVAVTDAGAEVLTPFQASADRLVIGTQ